MQLKRSPGALRRGLMAATCSLLAPAAMAQSGAEGEQPWQADAGLLYYKENGGRVQTAEPVVALRKDYGDERVLDLTFSFDSLSGGSPNGAIPSKKAQTFATPSGTSLKAASGVPVTYTTASGQTVATLSKVTLYTVAPGELPLDKNFYDRRLAVDIGWSQPLGANNHVSVGGHLSKELDFLSAGGSASISRDFDSKNTTLGLSVNGEIDSIQPIGGAPVEGSEYTLLEKQGHKSKDVLGAALGLTQVMTRIWVTQINLAYDSSHGYLTDPYKVVSVLDGSGANLGYRFETRPGDRTRESIYFGNKVAIGHTALDLSARHGKDSWGIKSDTVDARWRFNLSDDEGALYLEPHARWYRQSAADFYSLYLDGGSALPAHYSADQRLAAFTGKTLGLKLGVPVGDTSEFSVRLESYQQTPKVTTSALPQLIGLDLNPGLKTVIFQVGWHQQF